MALYPQFQARVLAMNADYQSRGTPVTHADELLKRWVNTPLQAFYCLALDLNGRVFAHLCAYLAVDREEPFALIYQCQCDNDKDATHTVRPIITSMFWAMGEWIQTVNRELPKAKVQTVDFWTPWDPKIWQRYFGPLLHLTRVFSVMRFDIDNLRNFTGIGGDEPDLESTGNKEYLN